MSRIAGIGLSGQMLGPVHIDKNNKPLRHVLLWNDGRSVRECAELLEAVPDIGMRTNCTPDPGVGAPKLMWLAKHEPHIIEHTDCLLLPKDYVRLKLTGQRFSEPSDAGGTMLMDVATSSWSHELCHAINWNPDTLPELLWSWESAGQLRDDLCTRFNIKKGVPVAAGAGDNMACSLGVGVAKPGDSAITIGTSGVICTVSKQFVPLPDAAVLTSHHAAPDSYLSMGVVMSATASVDWLTKLTGETTASLSNRIDQLYKQGKAFDSPVCAPWLNGIRTPRNQPMARGIMSGLSLTTDVAMLGWSLFEGVAFQFKECQDAQLKAGLKADNVTLVGGGANNQLWCTIIATLLDQRVTLPIGRDLAACIGATRLAQVAAGMGSVEEILHRKPRADIEIEPEREMAAMLLERYEQYLCL